MGDEVQDADLQMILTAAPQTGLQHLWYMLLSYT